MPSWQSLGIFTCFYSVWKIHTKFFHELFIFIANCQQYQEIPLLIIPGSGLCLTTPPSCSTSTSSPPTGTPPTQPHAGIYTLSTHYLHNIYTISTHYITSTDYLHNIYALSTHYLLTNYKLSTNYLHSPQQRYVQFMLESPVWTHRGLDATDRLTFSGTLHK